jgi:hypothetical protein
LVIKNLIFLKNKSVFTECIQTKVDFSHKNIYLIIFENTLLVFDLITTYLAYELYFLIYIRFLISLVIVSLLQKKILTFLWRFSVARGRFELPTSGLWIEFLLDFYPFFCPKKIYSLKMVYGLVYCLVYYFWNKIRVQYTYFFISNTFFALNIDWDFKLFLFVLNVTY